MKLLPNVVVDDAARWLLSLSPEQRARLADDPPPELMRERVITPELRAAIIASITPDPDALV